MASQIAIKMLGTNGGGYTNANAAHPFENPTPLSNFIQMLSIFAIPSALTYYLGRMVKNQRHGWAVWAAMFDRFRGRSPDLLARRGGWQSDHAALGRRSRRRQHGRQGSALRHFQFGAVRDHHTDASCGAVNSMHDSFTPLGGFIPLFNIQLGEIIFGGVGAGLYGMISLSCWPCLLPG